MSALEFFDAYVSKIELSQEKELSKFIKEHRDIILEINSEDERYRYIEEFFKELNEYYKKHIGKK